MSEEEIKSLNYGDIIEFEGKQYFVEYYKDFGSHTGKVVMGYEIQDKFLINPCGLALSQLVDNCKKITNQ